MDLKAGLSLARPVNSRHQALTVWGRQIGIADRPASIRRSDLGVANLVGVDGGSLQEQIQELISYPRESSAKRWLDLECLVEPGKIGVYAST